MLKKALFSMLALILGVFLTIGISSAADKFPSKSLSMIVGFAPGGSVDNMVRGIAPYFQKAIGQTVVVEGKVGSSGALARNYVYEAKPDGYTIYGGLGQDLVYHKMFKDADKFDNFLKAFKPIASWLNGDGNTIVVPKNSPINTWEDFVAAAKTKTMKVGFAGSMGSSDHASFLIIQKSFGIKFNLVPYLSSGEVAVAIRGGHLDMGSLSLSAAAFDPKEMKPIITTLEKRFETISSVPTFVEKGHPELNIGLHVGAFAPRDTPEDIMNILEDGFKKAFNDPAFQKWAKDLGKPLGDFYDRKKWTEYMERFDKEVDSFYPLMQADLDRIQSGKK
jgi:tripartite-type tricarboxylate transporter receptor subunit TctC